MAVTAVGYVPPAPSFDVSFRRPPLSERSAQPLLVGIGDPVAGPLVGLFYDAPSTPEQLAGPPDLAPAHSHPCDNFRVVMKGRLIVGNERYEHGQFRLQRSGRPYGRDGDAPHADGNWRIILFADRRGHRVRPTNPELRKQYASPEAYAETKRRFGSVLPEILDDDDDGVNGLVTSIELAFSKLGHVDSSFDAADTWRPLDGGARIAVTLMGHQEVGPIVILQRTPAAAEATPSLRFGADTFRCVIAGSDRAGRQMGDARFEAAGGAWPAVVAGSDGLDEVLVIGDRRGALAPPDAPWSACLSTIVGELTPRVRALVA